MNIKPLILFLILGIFNANALEINQNPEEYKTTNYRLLCHYTYERIETSQPQTSTFVTYGQKNESGAIEFSKTISNISAYSFYFSNEAPYPIARWHHDSKIRIDLRIQGSDIEYRYRFYNYTDNNNFKVVFDETREIYRPGLSYLNESAFNYYEGQLIDSEVNQMTWVNERGVSLDKCRIDIY